MMPNGANGLHLTGNLVSQANSGGGFSSVLDWLGTANNGLFIGSMRLSWNFSVGFTPGSQTLGANFLASDYTWTLDYWFNGKSIHVQEVGSGVGPNTPFTGMDSAAFNGTISDWEAKLTVSRGGSVSGDKLTVTVPNSSVDFNPATSVPEPATMGLIGSALGFLWWRKRRWQT